MKVLVVRVHLDKRGGIVQSLLETLPRLPSLDVEPTMVVFGGERGAAHAELEAAGVPVMRIAPTSVVGRALAIRRLVAQESFDVVHSSQADAHLPARLGARLARIPQLTSIMNRAFTAEEVWSPSRRRRMFVRLDRWSARHLTQRFHAVSHAAAASWIDELGIPASKVSVVERGRDPDRYFSGDVTRRRATRAAIGVTDDAELILNVGRQHRQKGQVDLVDAFAIVAARRPSAVLVLAGDEQGTQQAIEERRVASGFADRIHVLGHRDDIPDLLNAADVFAFPSVYEGLGGAAIEAMAAGLPMVVSDIPPMHELVVDGVSGRIVDARDPVVLAAGIEQILGDPELGRTLARNAHVVFLERFTIERCATRMADLYRSVAAREAAGPRGAPVSHSAST